jgi:hypothetical protein
MVSTSAAGEGPLHGIPMIPIQLLLSLRQMLPGDLHFGFGAHESMVGIRPATGAGVR